jgi:hypothetical protein
MSDFEEKSIIETLHRWISFDVPRNVIVDKSEMRVILLPISSTTLLLPLDSSYFVSISRIFTSLIHKNNLFLFTILLLHLMVITILFHFYKFLH